MISASQVPRLAVVRLENVRGFVELELHFEFEARAAAWSERGDDDMSLRSMAVVIGRNATNKSTLLRSVALALASSTDASAMLAAGNGSLIRHGAKEAVIEVEVEFEDGERQAMKKVLSFDKLGQDQLVEYTGPSAEELNMLVCGYGAARGLTGTDSGRDYRVWDGVATMFDPRAQMLSPELTLRRLADFLSDNDRYRQTLHSIGMLMGFDGGGEIELASGGGIIVSAVEVGSAIPIEALADGYRVSFNWIIDLYGRALSRDWITEDGEVKALVLIDEVDQHLHPELQTRLVSQLERSFPLCNFIVTTHSPLVALGADPEQLVVLHREADEVHTQMRIPDYRAYSPEDVLSDSRLFGTEATNPDFERLLARHEELGSTEPANRTEAESEELRKVAAQLRSSPPSNNDLRAEILDELGDLQ